LTVFTNIDIIKNAYFKGSGVKFPRYPVTVMRYDSIIRIPPGILKSLALAGREDRWKR
jgi:hypothetical protein